MNPMMLGLRELNLNDVVLLQNYLNNPNVTKYLTTSIPQPYTRADAEWWISEGSNAGIVRAIDYAGNFVGAVGANRKHFEHSRSAEVGYWLSQDYWGKGIATAALEQLTSLVFKSTDIVRLQAHVFEGNTASAKVLEKAGYRLEGVLKQAIFKNDKLMDAFLYAAIK